MKVKIIAEGGSMQPGPALAQQLGPMGVNIGKVISDVNEATKKFKGIKIPVELNVDAKTKQYTITLSSPSVSELLKKELNLEKGSGEPHEYKVGNLAIEQLISISKTKLPSLLAKDLKSALKMVTGTCVSLGILTESKDPKELMKEIEKGVYDKEISQEKTEVSSDKKKNLDSHFNTIKLAQEKKRKELEAAKAAEEAAKAEALTAVSAVAKTATSGAPETASGESKPEEAKK